MTVKKALVTSSIPELLQQWSHLSDSSTRDTIIAIGNFDGVHLGHQRVLNHACEVARQQPAPQKTKTIVITFDPPAKVLFHGQKYLTDRAEKIALLQTFAVDAIVMIPFTQAYAQTDKQVFIDELHALRPSHIIVGEDFRFGHKRQGGLDDLSHVADYLEVVGMYSLEDETVKSSHIRRLLEDGQVADATRFLGRRYSARGVVIEGDKRGRTLGYPTANLAIPPEKALPQGVFAAWVDIAEGRFMGMVNVGQRPTFKTKPPALEVNLFDVNLDLYGREVVVHFVAFVRSQRAFSGIDTLKAQLVADEDAIRAILTKS